MPMPQQDYSSERLPLSNAQPAAQPSTEAETRLPGQRAVTGGYSRRCPTCDAPTGANQTVCPQCGTRLQRRAEIIRCRHCGQRSASQLVLCSHCGRELQAAPSRFLTLGLPSALVLLFVLVLTGQFGLGSPLGWFQRQMTGSLQVINNIAITPVHGDDVTQTADSTDDSSALVALRPLAPSMQNTSSPASSTENAEVVASPATVVVEPTAELAPLSEIENSEPSENQGNGTVDTAIVVAEATETPTATATTTATEMPTPTETTLPTETSTSGEGAAVTETVAPTEPLQQATVAATGTVTTTASFFAARRSQSATVQATTTPSQTSTEETINLDISATLEAIRANSTPTATLSTATATAPPSPSPDPTETPVPSSTYTVRSGDTLVEIAEQFDIPMDELMEANGLTPTTAANLAVGRVLVLPGVAGVEDERTQTYVVRSGDTFVSIALRFNVDVEALLRVNGRTANSARDLQVGQTLIIPASNTASNTLQIQGVPTSVRPTNTPTPAPTEYTVQAGDTVVAIARRFGTTSQVLLAFNNLTDASARTLRPGDTLLIPPSGQR